MTKRIFHTTLFVAMITLLLSIASILGIMYSHLEHQIRREMVSEANLVVQGIEHEGLRFFEDINVSSNRITWIKSDGTVLYDNTTDAAKMDNHADREEFQEARELGVGNSERFSSTMGEKTLYYACRLRSDGSVLRISSTQNSVLTLMAAMLQPLLLVIAVALGLSALLASKAANMIVKPINELNLDAPEENDVYDEISPLLFKLQKQNQTIQNQIQDLQQKKQEFIAITENMSEGFLLVDAQTRIVSYNKSALKLLGAENMERQQVEGYSILTLNRTESFQKAVELSIGGTHNEQTLQMEGRTYDVVANPVYEGQRLTGAVIIIMDITEKSEQEAMRREFTANVSHELKTPLTAISGTAEIMKNGIIKPEDIPRFAESIYKEAQQLIALVSDIIRLSQLDENVIPIAKEEVNLYSLSKHVIERLESHAVKNDIHLKLDGEAGFVSGVPQILEEMVYNLCDNAIRYNKPGGSVLVHVQGGRNGAVVTVTDNGVGIPQKDVDRVFERFYRVDKSHSRAIGGTGLGLSIVKHGAQYHGGQIHVESKLGKGTSISIEFPAM